MHKSINIEQRLRLSILLGFLVVTFVVWAILYLQGKELNRIASHESFSSTEQQVIAEVNGLSAPLEQELDQIQQWGEAGMFEGKTPAELESFFKPVLRSLDIAHTIFYDSNEEQLLLHRENDSVISRIETADTLIGHDSTAYSSHARPWLSILSNSKEPITWTEPYFSSQENQPAITVATSWKDSTGKPSVLAFDLLLTRLSVLVQTLAVGDGGKVYLVNRSTLNRDTALARSSEMNSVFTDPSIAEDSVFSSIMRRDFKSESEIEPGLYSLTTEKGKYWAKFVPLTKLIPSYSILIIAPSKGLNEKIEKKSFLINMLSGIILFSCLPLLIILLYQTFFTYKLIKNVGELNTIFSNSRNLESFLNNTVVIIAKFMRVPVCSIYLYDESTNSLILKATQGLNKKLVNETSIPMGEGLVGQTLKELRPIRAIGASLQAGYKRVEGLEEEPYESFLGIPITRGLHKIGVLVIQKRKGGTFSSRTVDTLGILASQLTGVLKTTGVLLSASAEMPEFLVKDFPVQLTEIKGKGAAPGYALGPCSIDHKRDIFMILKRMEWETTFKLKDFENAVNSTEQELGRLQRLVEERLEDSAAMIFVAHLLMLKDTSFAGAIRDHIANGVPVPEAVLRVAEHLIRSFSSSPARMIQEKAEDVKDLAVRLLSHFSPDLNRRQNHNDRIVLARELLPSDILVMASEGVKGVVLVSGGATSHLAILCRSLQIPLILTTDSSILGISPESDLLLDAHEGIIFVNPDKELQRKYRPLLAGNIAGVRSAQKNAVTVDGTAISVHANINLITDISQAMNLNIEGIGLYRSEFPFMIRESFPTESEQFAIYKKVAEFVPHREMTFRTLDIGGDKMLPYLEGIAEENPFLGLRAIRFSLLNEPLFVSQLKAILRAAANTDLRIMFPMIQSLDEFNSAKSIVLRTVEELQSNGILCHPTPKIGMMVELPAAVTLIEQFAKVSDFFSIGTNDLIQYLLAVDRTNAEVAPLYKPHHPAVLASIAKVAETAIAHGRDLSVCGDMAGNERYIPFLIGCGITKLSVDPVFIPKVQETICRINKNEAVELTQRLLSCATIAEAETILRQGA